MGNGIHPSKNVFQNIFAGAYSVSNYFPIMADASIGRRARSIYESVHKEAHPPCAKIILKDHFGAQLVCYLNDFFDIAWM